MNCPICGAARGKHLFTVRKPALPGAPEYDLRACQDCGFWHAEGPLNDAIMAAIYGPAFHRSSQQTGNHPERSPIAANAARRVARLKLLRDGGSLLDIGAGRGYFVRQAASVYAATGIEYTPDAVASARADGVELIAGDFLSYDFAGRQFDVVTLWDVLACFPDPGAVMHRVRELLAPGGLLVMTVPYVSSWPARLLGRAWPLMIPPISFSYFSRGSVPRLLENHGLVLNDMHTEGKTIALDFLLRKLLRSASLNALERWIPGWTARRNVYLNLGDIITVYANKPAAHG